MLKLFLAGDVMIGRGIDQILPYPCDPQIFEDDLKSALDYVRLAEAVHGSIPMPVSFDYVWGDALAELSLWRPDMRIVNLETAITQSPKPEPKGINYRLNPANIEALTAAKIDCCVLSNNHVLDWGENGLLETIDTLKKAGIRVAGAGVTLPEALRPAILPCYSGRVLVFGFGLESSGIPRAWAATRCRPGVSLLPDLSAKTAEAVASDVLSYRKPNDIVVLSLHWGSNWGYEIDAAQVAFAHALIDHDACDILHGHSSHHARAIEIYRGKLVLYGCGDFLNDYEGIAGFEEYRGDLAPMYLAAVNRATGDFEALTIALFRMCRFRLEKASARDVRWFQSKMNAISPHLPGGLTLDGKGDLRWMQSRSNDNISAA
jgi:poly-gamma-glutamate synthesis protein (capsule biosynthesis protein)